MKGRAARNAGGARSRSTESNFPRLLHPLEIRVVPPPLTYDTKSPREFPCWPTGHFHRFCVKNSPRPVYVINDHDYRNFASKQWSPQLVTLATVTKPLYEFASALIRGVRAHRNKTCDPKPRVGRPDHPGAHAIPVPRGGSTSVSWVPEVWCALLIEILKKG